MFSTEKKQLTNYCVNSLLCSLSTSVLMWYSVDTLHIKNRFFKNSQLKLKFISENCTVYFNNFGIISGFLLGFSYTLLGGPVLIQLRNFYFK